MSSCKEDDDGDGEARDSVEGSTDMMVEVNRSQVYVTVTAFSEDQGAPENSETTRVQTCHPCHGRLSTTINPSPL